MTEKTDLAQPTFCNTNTARSFWLKHWFAPHHHLSHSIDIIGRAPNHTIQSAGGTRSTQTSLQPRAQKHDPLSSRAFVVATHHLASRPFANSTSKHPIGPLLAQLRFHGDHHSIANQPLPVATPGAEATRPALLQPQASTAACGRHQRQPLCGRELRRPTACSTCSLWPAASVFWLPTSRGLIRSQVVPMPVFNIPAHFCQPFRRLIDLWFSLPHYHQAANSPSE